VLCLCIPVIILADPTSVNQPFTWQESHLQPCHCCAALMMDSPYSNAKACCSPPGLMESNGRCNDMYFFVVISDQVFEMSSCTNTCSTFP
jgi:hypothetical protein